MHLHTNINKNIELYVFAYKYYFKRNIICN
jgi:hypothetical protein